MERPRNCPRCNTTNLSGERRRGLGGSLEEVYVSCNVCRQEVRLRLTTEAIERERESLKRHLRNRRRAGASRVSSEQVRLQFARLRNAAVREGLADQIEESLCPPDFKSR
jgi:hypothetical protein